MQAAADIHIRRCRAVLIGIPAAYAPTLAMASLPMPPLSWAIKADKRPTDGRVVAPRPRGGWGA